MSYSPILIVGGEPNSIFLEIFFKTLKFHKIKSPIILISSENNYELKDGKLADIAPTILELMSIELPNSMNGLSLLKR